MFSEELRGLLFQVIKSWQVIAVTIVLVVYMSLVSYAARAHHKPSSVSKTKPKKIKKPNTAATPAAAPAAKAPAAKAPAEPAITEQE